MLILKLIIINNKYFVNIKLIIITSKCQNVLTSQISLLSTNKFSLCLFSQLNQSSPIHLISNYINKFVCVNSALHECTHVSQ